MRNDEWTTNLSRCRSPSSMIWMGEVIGCDPDGSLKGEGGINAPAPINAPQWFNSAPPWTWHTPIDPAIYTSAIAPYTTPLGVLYPRYLARFSHGRRMSCSFYDGHVSGVSLQDMVGDGSTSNLWYGSR